MLGRGRNLGGEIPRLCDYKLDTNSIRASYCMLAGPYTGGPSSAGAVSSVGGDSSGRRVIDC